MYDLQTIIDMNNTTTSRRITPAEAMTKRGRYGFSTKVDDQGRITLGDVVSLPSTAESTSWSTTTADHYIDVFNSLAEARKARREAAREA